MIRVLIADDSPVFRAGMRQFLEADGRFRVVAESGDGLATVREALRTQPDLIIVDVRMPEQDGLSAAREILKYWPQARILVLTEYETPTYEAQATAIGCRACLPKDVPFDVLLDVCERVGHKESVPCPPVSA